MEFRMLGPLSVEDGGREIALGGPKQRTVLGLLLADANKVVSTDRLIDELYGESPPESARKSLQSYVANLRKAINQETEILRGKSPGYVLEVDTRRVDALYFESLVHQARSLRSTDPAAAGERLTEALALWYGVPLVDIADEAPTLRNLAGKLEELRLTAMEDRIDAQLTLDQNQTAVPELENLTVQHPLRERFWGQLMLALYRSGRQAEALRTFQRARRLLADELGIDPSPDLQSLEQRILDQDPTLGTAPEQTESPAAAALLEPGRTVRGYELRQVLSSGGTARLFRAYHPAVGREVAVEAVSAAPANDPEFVRTFEPRAARLARLEHPHLVPLLDYWREPGGAYLVTRWYQGGTLQEALQTGPWKVEAVARLIDQIGPALAAAHRSGVMHGHIVPAAVLLDQSGNAYLGRFTLGITDLSDGSDPRLDRPRDVGDLALLAAEALAGRRSGVDDTGLHLPESVPGPVADLLSAASADPAGLDVDGFVEAFRTAAGAGAVVDEDTVSTGLVANPYKGLRPFEEADAGDFFGRRHLTERLVSRMAEPTGRFLAVIGPSGSGKSSVVRAGLIPRLRAGAVSGSEGWFVAEMSPGAHPFEELETALLRVAVNPPTTLIDQLETDPRGLMRAVRRVLPSRETDLVLVIDQFEELFTLVEDEAERDRFIEGLVVACTDPRTQLRVVITMRADFYDRPLSYPALAGIVTARMETIFPMTPEELEQAIAGPAERVGVTAEPELEVRIVTDVANQPGALPLLQYAMTELFDRREGSLLTLEAYQEIGGVQGALVRRAEELFSSLDPEGREAARQLFLRLVTPDADAGAIRRRALRTELAAMEGRRKDIDEVLEKFAAHRLLTLDHDSSTRAPTVEVAHDALLGEWPRLRGWVADARQDLRFGRSLSAAAAEWIGSGHDDSYLLGGSRLAQYETWAGAAAVGLTRTERHYLDAGLAQRSALEAAEQARRQREFDLERRSARRLRILVGVLAVATVVALVLSLIARRQARIAEHNLAISTARALTAEAIGSLEVDPELAALLALEAAQAARDVDEPVLRETVEVLHRALLADRMVIAVSGGRGGFNPDGTRLVTADAGTILGGGEQGGDVTVWDVETGDQILVLSGHTDRTTDAGFDPTGRLIVTASMDGTARIWEASTGTQQSLLSGHSGWLTSAIFSLDGLEVITTAVDGTARRWAVADGEELAVYPFDDIAIDVAMAPDGRLAVALDMSGAAIVDMDGSELLRLTGHTAGVCGVAFSPDGSLLLTGAQDATARLWNSTTGELIFTLMGHSGPACGVDISRDGARLATGAEDGTARIWDAGTGRLEFTLFGHQAGIATARFSPDGRLLATASGDQTTRVWEVTEGGSREDLVVAGHDGAATVAEVSPDGSLLFTGGEDGKGKLWVVDDGDLVHTLEGHVDRIFGASFSSDGTLLATSSEDTTARIWDVRSGRQIHTLTDHIDTVWGLDFNEDGTRLLTGSLDSTVRVWDVETGAAVATLDLNQRGVFSVGYSHDQSLVLALGEGLSVFDAETSNPLLTLESSQGAILGHALSPDGTMLASAGADGTVVLFEIGREGGISLTEVGTLTGHTGGVLNVVFSPDGTTLATSSLDNSVKLWSLDGEELLSLPGVTAPGTISFNPDGTRLAVPGADGAARFLIVPVDELFDIAHERLSRDFTPDECERYLRRETCSTS